MNQFIRDQRTDLVLVPVLKCTEVYIYIFLATLLVTPVHLLIHAVMQSAKQVGVGVWKNVILLTLSEQRSWRLKTFFWSKKSEETCWSRQEGYSNSNNNFGEHKSISESITSNSTPFSKEQECEATVSTGSMKQDSGKLGEKTRLFSLNVIVLFRWANAYRYLLWAESCETQCCIPVLLWSSGFFTKWLYE